LELLNIGGFRTRFTSVSRPLTDVTHMSFSMIHGQSSYPGGSRCHIKRRQSDVDLRICQRTRPFACSFLPLPMCCNVGLPVQLAAWIPFPTGLTCSQYSRELARAPLVDIINIRWSGKPRQVTTNSSSQAQNPTSSVSSLSPFFSLHPDMANESPIHHTIRAGNRARPGVRRRSPIRG
jgi:hypothetical protein